MFNKTRNWIHTEKQRIKIQDINWKPKVRTDEYAWRAVVHSQITDIEYEYLFTSRELARRFKKATEASMTSPQVVIDKIAMPDEDGWMTHAT